jgi:hypothetical protein
MNEKEIFESLLPHLLKHEPVDANDCVTHEVNLDYTIELICQWSNEIVKVFECRDDTISMFTDAAYYDTIADCSFKIYKRTLVNIINVKADKESALTYAQMEAQKSNFDHLKFEPFGTDSIIDTKPQLSFKYNQRDLSSEWEIDHHFGQNADCLVYTYDCNGELGIDTTFEKHTHPCTKNFKVKFNVPKAGICIVTIGEIK